MILINPKYAGWPDPQRPIMAPKMGISGEIKCIMYDENLRFLYETPWAPNLITNNGLDIIRVGPYNHDYKTVIGSGTTPAAFTDTSIESKLAHTSNSGAGDGSQSVGSAPDWEYSEISSRRFNAGVGTGTVSEACFSQNDAGTNIFNRVLLPAPIVKAANQVLDVVFRLTIWPPSVDINGTSTINGDIYDTITRGRDYPVPMGSGGLATVYEQFGMISSYATWRAASGNLGLITDASPQGQVVNAENGAFYLASSSYVAGNRYYDVTAYSGLDGWNLTGGLIRSLTGNTQKFAFQTQFNKQSDSSAVPKDNTQIMDMTWRFSWDRV